MPAAFGLDIGSTSIKILSVDGSKVSAIGITANPFGKSISRMTNAEKISATDLIKNLIKEAAIRGNKVVASIPESEVFSKVMKFPVMSTPELATAIKWEIDQSVPFPPNEVETSWAIIEKPDKVVGDEKVSVYVVAVPSGISATYVQMLELVGLEVIRLENEIPALVRSFADGLTNSNPAIILDLGASGTSIVMVGKSKLFGNYYLPVGGAAMTKLIADSFNLPFEQAESYKRTYGIDKNQLEGKMVAVLKPVLDTILGEVKKMMVSFQEEQKDLFVNKVILTGGGSYLIGLIPYLTETLGGIEVVTGDVFFDKAMEAKYKGLGPVFAIANGLSKEI